MPTDQLHPSLSFCEIDGRYVFLDLAGDRYFSLDGALACSWRALLAGRATSSDRQAIAARKLIVTDGGRPLESCRDDIARQSCLDGAQLPSSVRAGLRHAVTVARTRRRIRRSGVMPVLGDYIAYKSTARPGNSCAHHLADIVREFILLDRFVTTLDQCLPRSLALASHLARLGLAPDLVFAVRLGPFAAHCWVECADLLANERYERARHFKPILRV